ncbi:MAG TPA: IclR family transcriptional regulator [Kofleriaceae bacterium]|nr:IclR family transcriptional regulator [Kofleriaceae bacterium]
MTALARGLEVLACFRSGDTLLGNGDLAERCRLPKSTVSRLSQTLARLGYLRYVDDVAKYRLGGSTLALGSAMLSGMAIRQLARPMMQEIADFSQAVVALGIRVGLGVIYVEVCRNKAALTLSLDVGSWVPLATTAIGRAALAAADDDERADLMQQLRAADPAAWPRRKRVIDAAIEEHRKTGCCSSFGEWQPDVNGVAIGLRPGRGLPVMALNCGGPSFSLSRPFLLGEVRPRLASVVRRLEDSLGSAASAGLGEARASHGAPPAKRAARAR